MSVVRIFLAEDNQADVYLLEEALREHGVQFELQVAGDGEKALDAIQNLAAGAPVPNLFLLDLNLPKIGGDALLQSIRAETRFDGIPVMILSSSDAPEDRRTADRSGARYVKKPCALDEYMRIGAIVKEVCGDGSAAAH